MAKEKFLLWMLAGIFTYQAAIFSMATYYCAVHGGLKVCPEIGQRYDKTFDIMVATTLALLSGKVLNKE